MPSPSTHQDSPKVPERWPVVELSGFAAGTYRMPGQESPPGSLASSETYIPVSALLSDEVVERVGEAMEDWLMRMHGVTSSHRPGKADDGREARTLLEAAIEGGQGG